MNVTIFGCGYTGHRLALLEKAAGNTVFCYVRSRESLGSLSAMNFMARQIDLDDDIDLPDGIHDSELIYYFIPPPTAGETDPRFRRLLQYLEESQKQAIRNTRIVLISTTGVYGDRQGQWVTEETPANPSNSRSLRRFDAEQQLIKFQRKTTGFSFVILRVAGIYGPERLPVERLKKGIPVVIDKEAPYSNRIHVDDLVCSCFQSAHKSPDNEIYNVSDGLPSTMTDYFMTAAAILGYPCPKEISMVEARQLFTAAQLSFHDESRKISNKKLLSLGFTLKYPDLKSGLLACIQ